MINLVLLCSCSHKEPQNIGKDAAYNVPLVPLKTVLKTKAESYADSLMSMNKMGMPYFLTQNNFEISNHLYWDSPYKPISIRKLILQEIKKVDILDSLINLKIPEDKQIDAYFPYIDYSFKELAKLRKEELIQQMNIVLE